MDIKLYYQEKGTGEPLILLHGNGEDSSYFINQIDYFQNAYHVIALDTRGHGKSPRGEAPFTIEQFSCDLYDFMQGHQISNAIILGFSDGANIAMKFAMKHPSMVKGLILNGGNLEPMGVKRTTQIPIEIGYKIAMKEIGLEPMLNLDMRLGEGSGCPIAFSIVEFSCAMMNNMATFDEAGINDDYLDDVREEENYIV